MLFKALFVLFLLTSQLLICEAGVMGAAAGLIACKAGCASAYAACIGAGCGLASKLTYIFVSMYKLKLPFFSF